MDAHRRGAVLLTGLWPAAESQRATLRNQGAASSRIRNFASTHRQPCAVPAPTNNDPPIGSISSCGISLPICRSRTLHVFWRGPALAIGGLEQRRRVFVLVWFGFPAAADLLQGYLR